jgi:hypothetical protein
MMVFYTNDLHDVFARSRWWCIVSPRKRRGEIVGGDVFFGEFIDSNCTLTQQRIDTIYFFLAPFTLRPFCC